MKKTWIVTVGMEAGHELTDLISESEFYGPYTHDEAKRLEKELEELFVTEHETEGKKGERRQAQAIPLVSFSVRQLLEAYRIEMKENDDGDE